MLFSRGSKLLFRHIMPENNETQKWKVEIFNTKDLSLLSFSTPSTFWLNFINNLGLKHGEKIKR